VPDWAAVALYRMRGAGCRFRGERGEAVKRRAGGRWRRRGFSLFSYRIGFFSGREGWSSRGEELGGRKAEENFTSLAVIVDLSGVPYRIRTGVAAVRGRCPGPLDEGDVSGPCRA
jgi:hypothetical protein